MQIQSDYGQCWSNRKAGAVTLATIEVGQIWREVDPRQERYVRVEGTGPTEIRIRTVVRNEDGAWVVKKGTRECPARRERFNGQPGGYLWVSRTGI